jgi:HK97 family phage major capsid protein
MIQYPRQVGVTVGTWVGENTDAPASYPETGSLMLRAKKCISFVVMPNDLLRYASVAAEALIRSDMTKSLALTADLAYIAGSGSGTQPEGILETANVGVVIPTTPATDGDTLSPQDLYKFLAVVEGNNAEFEGFILRPDLFYQFVMARAGVYNGSGVVQSGQFVYDQFRELGSGFDKVLGGFKAVTSKGRLSSPSRTRAISSCVPTSA